MDNQPSAPAPTAPVAPVQPATPSPVAQTGLAGDVVKFWDSAIGKTIKTGLWIAGSALLALAAHAVLGLHWVAVAGLAPALNFVIYGLNVFINNNIPNLPTGSSSTGV